MKNTTKVATLLMITGFFTACQQSLCSRQIVADQSQREEVMRTIVSNQDMMTEMVDMMINNEQGKKMMRSEHMMQAMVNENPGMMQKMMRMCQNDSVKCNQMAEMMSGNKEMMQSMMGMMHQKGLMNDESFTNSMNMTEKAGAGK